MTGRLALLVVLGSLLLAAPTPGSVGACGSDERDFPADFMDYCQKREQLGCVRRFLRKEITGPTRDTCRLDAVDACGRSAFPADCQPTRRETDACLNALSSFDTLDTKEADLAECKQNALCHATPSEQHDSGLADGGLENP
jgi:hypothetical protein